MDVQARLNLVQGIAAMAAVAALLTTTAGATPPRAPVELLEDASLNDVFFLDPDRGWAVGDRGAIWHTEDGGRQWRLQDSPVGCRLYDVWFLDGENGWAVGGWPHPYTHKTTGVVLRTMDGGQTWRLLPSAAIPTLRQIHMFDAKSGWALGVSSALYPSGVFRTEDGGRGWAPVSGDRSQGWLSGDFRDRMGGILAGESAVALVGTNRFYTAAAPLAPSDVVRRLRLAEHDVAWMAGDTGLLLHSRNGGAAWTAPPGRLPDGTRAFFDFHALTVWRQHVWVAGAPGTVVFHSPDGGVSWETLHTDQPLPIRALHFLNENHGWAVGELGTILVTRDGGRSWLPQRGPTRRLAVLGVFGSPHSAPWELFVRLAGNEGYLTGLECLTHQEFANPSAESPLEDRVREAALTVGACASSQTRRFPLPDSRLGFSLDQIARRWGASAGSTGPAATTEALARLEEHLVRKIRQWRPDVIVTESAAPSGDALARAINRAVLNAVAAAADSASHPDHGALCGLGPWTVKKVCGVQPAGETGTISIVAASLAPRLGGTLADGAAAARSHLDAEYRVPPPQLELQVLIDRTAKDGERRRDVMGGIVLAVGSDARRRLTDPSPGSLDLVAKTAQKQRNIQQIIAHNLERSSDAILGQVNDLIRDFPTATGGDMLFQLAERLRYQGRPDLAAPVYQQLYQQQPQHPASEAALLRLVQYGSSGEAAAQAPQRAEIRRGVGQGVQAASFEAPFTKSEQDATSNSPLGAIIRIRDAAAGSIDADRRQRDAQTLTLAQTGARTHPALFAEPGLRFALAAAARRQGNPREAERFFSQLSGRSEANAWRHCAQSEMWLMKPAGDPIKPIARCLTMPERPYLDGRLDEKAWRDVAPINLTTRFPGHAQGDNGSAPSELEAATRAYIARDKEYLYFAIQCRKSPGLNYKSSSKPRTYDAPLEDQDRVDLMIDVDRDYATYYRFTVDHRGWTGEACLGDPSWNPQWFVAASSDDQSWTVEAAVPIHELTAAGPRERDVWAAGIQRIVPGVEFQSWTTPAAPGTRPEGFGLLILE